MKMGGKGGEMGGNGGKWRKMGGTGGNWGELGRNGKIAVIAHGMWVVEGCGGMWLRKMGETREKNGTNYPFSTVPFSPFSRRSKTFPPISFAKTSSSHSQTEKRDVLPLTDTHRHSGWCGCL